MIKRDLIETFRQIFVATFDHWLLSFRWHSQYWKKRFLSFDLRIAFYLFDLFAKELQWKLITNEWRSRHYLDDFITFVASTSEVSEYENFFETICYLLELKINLKKNARDTLLDFLDIKLNTMTMIARLSNVKREKVIEWINKMLFEKMIKNELRFFLNFLSFAARVVVSRRVFLKRLFNFFSQSWRSKRRVDVEMKINLLWWKYFLSRWNEMKFLKRVETRREFVLWTNAFDEYDMRDYFVLHSESLMSSADNM
jgi:hypothetical protein